jgi:hypothetical protein
MAPSGVTNCLEMSHQEEIQPDRDCCDGTFRGGLTMSAHKGPSKHQSDGRTLSFLTPVRTSSASTAVRVIAKRGLSCYAALTV